MCDRHVVLVGVHSCLFPTTDQNCFLLSSKVDSSRCSAQMMQQPHTAPGAYGTRTVENVAASLVFALVVLAVIRSNMVSPL